MKLSDVSALQKEILEGKGYNEITLHDIKLLSMWKSLCKWARTVSVHEGIQDLKEELLLDSSRFGVEGVIVLLQTNLKTHKPPPGQVKPKVIHLATKNPLVPHGKCVAWKLRTVLSPRRHILNSVEEFHARVEELELDQDDRLITADVKDFIVGGDHWYLARMAASILEHEGQEFDRESRSVFNPKPVCDQHTERIRGSFPGGTRFGQRICGKWSKLVIQ